MNRVFIMLLVIMLTSSAFCQSFSELSNDHPQKITLSLTETPIAPSQENTIISPDGKHCAWVGRENGLVYVFLNGEKGKGYSDINDDSLRFSSQGNHLAYTVTLKDGKRCVVFDSIEGPVYDFLAGNPFSPGPNSPHICYIGIRGDKQFAVADRKELSPAYTGNTGAQFQFSPNGMRTAFILGTPGKTYAVIDGKTGKQYWVIRKIIFSPDSTHCAYIADTNTGKVHVVLDGISGSDYTGILDTSLEFSKDGKNIMYTAVKNGNYIRVIGKKEVNRCNSTDAITGIFSSNGLRSAAIFSKQGKSWVVTDGKKGKEYPSIELNSLCFSPDGKHVMYTATDGLWDTLVLDEKESDAYAGISHPIFSPDGKRVAHIGQKGLISRIIIDGKEGKEEKGIRDVCFSPDSKHLAYVTVNENGASIILDGKESGRYQWIDPASLIFSPDSKHLAYMVNSAPFPSDRMYPVVDNVRSQKFAYKQFGITFDTPSKLHYFIRSGDYGLARVDAQITELK